LYAKTILFQRGHVSSHPQPFVELGAVAGCCCTHNSFHFGVGMRATTHNRMWNWELFLAAVVPTTAFISVWGHPRRSAEIESVSFCCALQHNLSVDKEAIDTAVVRYNISVYM
jgi:hypothetical protein